MPKTETKARILESARTLIRGKGYGGTTISDIVEASGAPRGSLTYHFGGGKEEIALGVIELTSQRVLEEIADISSSVSSPEEVVSANVAYIRDMLEKSGFSDSCPVSPLTLELSNVSEAVRAACEQFFTTWQGAMSAELVRCGADQATATRVASLFVISIEGAFVVSRARRTVDALNLVSDELVELCRSSRSSASGVPSGR